MLKMLLICLNVDDNVNMMRGKDPYGYDVDSNPMLDEGPVVVLRGPHSRRMSQPLNVVTRSQSQAPIVIRGPSSSKSKQPVSKGVLPKSVVGPELNYNLFDQLQCTPT